MSSSTKGALRASCSREGGRVGALSTYRDRVVHLREGEKGFVPAFEEEKDGMEEAEILFLFQDPGKSGAEKSGKVSHTNDDDSAERMRDIFDELDLDWKKTISWTSIPWTDRDKDFNYDLKLVRKWNLIPKLLHALPKLKVVVLCGNVAWKIKGDIRDYYTDLRILTGPHPSNLGIASRAKFRHGLTREQRIGWLWNVIREAKRYAKEGQR